MTAACKKGLPIKAYIWSCRYLVQYNKDCNICTVRICLYFNIILSVLSAPLSYMDNGQIFSNLIKILCLKWTMFERFGGISDQKLAVRMYPWPLECTYGHQNVPMAARMHPWP